MKQLALLIALMFLALLVLSATAPQPAGAAVSPLPTPQLTPPPRPTPTGWPDAPFPTVTPRPAGLRIDRAERSDRFVSRGWLVPMVPR